MQHQGETVGVARARQQLLGGLRVVGFGFYRRHMAEYRRRHQVGCRDRRVFHQALDDGLAVDGLGDCQAHVDVFQWIFWQRLAGTIGDEGRDVAPLVHVKENRAPGNLLRKPEALVGADSGEVRRGDGLDGIDVTREQCGDARRVVGDDAEDHLVPGGRAAPVGRILRQFHAIATRKTREAEWARADHGLAIVEVLGRGIGCGLLRHDENRIEVIGHHGIGRRRLHANRVGVDRAAVGESLHETRVLAVGQLLRAVHGKQHVIRSEG